MKLSWSIICFFLIYPSLNSIAQNASLIGLELGVSFSQFPDNSNWDETAKYGTIEIHPMISPLLGISKDWTVLKHIQISGGVQYQMSGNRKYKYTKYTWPVINDYFEEWRTIKIHKICVPITLGYKFKVNKVNPSIYFGTRPNYILYAFEFNKTHSHNEPDRPPTVPQDEYSENEINIFKYRFHQIEPYIHYNPPKRLIIQFFAGVSTTIGQKIEINLSYNLGHNAYTIDYDYGYGALSETTALPGSDYVFSIQYNILQSVNRIK